MNRRKALQNLVFLTGAGVIGTMPWLSSCKTEEKKDGLFPGDVKRLLEEVSETIIPATPSSPGAREAGVSSFIENYVRDCYTEQEQKSFVDGITTLKKACQNKYGKGFEELAPSTKHAFLVQLDNEATQYQKTKRPEDADHYFPRMKNLITYVYFTSEVGATKALRYLPVPGRYEGEIAYKKGDKAWAL
jgi:hypothetical protein